MVGADGAWSTDIDRENTRPELTMVVREYPLNGCRYFSVRPRIVHQLDVTVHIKWIKVAFVAKYNAQ